MSLVTVRQATNEDSVRISELRASLRAEIFRFRGGSLLWEDKHELPDMNQTMVYVADVGDYVIGFMVLALRGDLLEVFEIHVDTECRGVGAGDAMVGKAMELARDNSATALIADALPGDRDTKNLFERSGLISQRLQMRREIA